MGCGYHLLARGWPSCSWMACRTRWADHAEHTRAKVVCTSAQTCEGKGGHCLLTSVKLGAVTSGQTSNVLPTSAQAREGSGSGRRRSLVSLAFPTIRVFAPARTHGATVASHGVPFASRCSCRVQGLSGVGGAFAAVERLTSQKQRWFWSKSPPVTTDFCSQTNKR